MIKIWQQNSHRPPDPEGGKTCNDCGRIYSKKIKVKGKMVCPFCHEEK